MAGANILGIIIGKLCYEKKLCLIILLKVDKDLEISFYHNIMPLDLAIYLWIKGVREFFFDAQEIA